MNLKNTIKGKANISENKGKNLFDVSSIVFEKEKEIKENIMTDTLIKGEMTVKADTNIKSNVSGKNIYETNGNLTVDDANMKFTENIVNRNKDYSQSIVKLNEAGK